MYMYPIKIKAVELAEIKAVQLAEIKAVQLAEITGSTVDTKVYLEHDF